MKPRFHDVEQGSEIWHSLRLGKVTSSSNAIFMANEDKAFGEPAKKLALQIALERINGFKSDVSYSNAHMERGHEQEPIARALYEQENFVNVDNGGFFDLGAHGDSPDGLVGDDGVIEIKSVIASTHYATLKRNNFDPSYLWQIIGHLDCTNRQWVDFISYCSEFPESKQLLVYRIWRKDCLDHIERLRARRNEFLNLVRTIESEIREEDFYNYAPAEVGGTVLQEA